MIGPFGVPELLILFLLFGVPIFALYKVAVARGQSRAYALWGVLSLVGVIVGVLLMIAMPRKGDAPEAP